MAFSSSADGWRFHLTKSSKVIRRIRISSKKRMRKRIRLLNRQCKQGMVDEEHIRSYQVSIMGYLEQANTGYLRSALKNEISDILHEEGV